jgi:hypothetical protein
MATVSPSGLGKSKRPSLLCHSTYISRSVSLISSAIILGSRGSGRGVGRKKIPMVDFAVMMKSVSRLRSRPSRPTAGTPEHLSATRDTSGCCCHREPRTTAEDGRQNAFLTTTEQQRPNRQSGRVFNLNSKFHRVRVCGIVVDQVRHARPVPIPPTSPTPAHIYVPSNLLCHPEFAQPGKCQHQTKPACREKQSPVSNVSQRS